MATTPSVADRQVTASSISATEMLKLWGSWSFKERTTWRRSLRDWACSMRSSRVRWATGMASRPRAAAREEFPWVRLSGVLHCSALVVRVWARDCAGSAQEGEGDDGLAQVLRFSEKVCFELVGQSHLAGG